MSSSTNKVGQRGVVFISEHTTCQQENIGFLLSLLQLLNINISYILTKILRVIEMWGNKVENCLNLIVNVSLLCRSLIMKSPNSFFSL